jgi:hypothetical protein
MGRARPSPTKTRPPRVTRVTRLRPSSMSLEAFGTSVVGGVVVKIKKTASAPNITEQNIKEDRAVKRSKEAILKNSKH